VLLVAGCATDQAASDARTTALLKRDSAWAALATEGRDIEAILAFWSDDAVVIPPGSPEVRGKIAIREYVQRSLAIPGFRISWRPAAGSVSSDGEVGYTLGENLVTFAGPDGKPVTVKGRYTTVWRRAPGGEWRCVVDIWNSP